MNWISRLDRLPVDGQRVLFSGIKQDGTRYVALGNFRATRDPYWTVAGSYVKLDRVSHWIPVPELPVLTARDTEALNAASERDRL